MKKNSKKHVQPVNKKKHDNNIVIVKKKGKKMSVTINGISAIKFVCIAFIIFVIISFITL